MNKKNLLIFFYIVLLTEFFSFLFSKLELLTYNETPNIYLKNKNFYPDDKWRNEKNEWGAWHINNSKINHVKSCWNVTYESNSIGARDNEFNKKSKKERSIVLGDSMGEGVGLDLKERFDEIVEEQIDHEILNFSSGGDLGPLAYFILYKNLASLYDHKNLFILFLPQNDFIDHNYNIWNNNGWNIHNFKKRYRPYSRKISDNDYEFFYEKNTFKIKNFGSDEEKFLFETKLFLKNYFWFTNTLRTISHYLKSKKLNEINNYATNSFYSNILNADYDSFYWIDKIIKQANNINVYLFVLPSYYDLVHINEYNLKKPIWYDQLLMLNKNKNLKSIIDLSTIFKDEPKSYFHKCDLHYNKKANLEISKVIEKILK